MKGKPTTYEPFECSCDQCINCCNLRPGWGTPKEILNLIENGLANKLSLDYYESGNIKHVEIIVPAIDGCGGGRVPLWPTGTCMLLVDNKCSIHDDKPLECSIAGCCGPPDTYYMKWREESIIKLWLGDEGKAVVNKWQASLGKL